MSETIGVAVVGAGGWGKNHVRNFASQRGASLRWVCDRSEAALAPVTRAWPDVKTTTSIDDVLADEGVRAIVIATDAPTHHDLAKKALERGRDVLVEKPLTLGASTSAELCDLAERGQRILMVGHLLLYHPAVERLKQIVDSGELGEVLYVTSQRTNLGVVRRDENAWWSLAPHDLSVAAYLLGAEPESVSASGGVFLQKERGIEDVVFATVRYRGGKLAHVHVSWLDPHKTRRLTVVGTKKMAVFDDASPDMKLTLFDKGVEPPPAALTYEQGVRIRTGDIVVPALKMAEPLGRETEAFLEAVRTRVPPLASGRSGHAVVRVLEAGQRSLAEAGRRVDIGL
ncbi:Gfo/Idh/MocA family protein [Sandaracinus amylolyticus]|uniref:Putative oxidoreductase n=1 Tax=Sandaracinus amylolyticus TaxID=927083 RepID=A0A0F6SHA7_9BACT|nr:Gfo/Idh/MocA family oxidoreductase [Sandaracinus amylolyticus]AKF10114.1 Putative oxidoreductase [Sandaracinus amylolyticus]